MKTKTITSKDFAYLAHAARAILARDGAVCCGGPASGTDHAPDCAFVLAWEEAAEELEAERYEAEFKRTGRDSTC